MAGRYRLGDPLGRGGMGEVYRATDEVLGREVAIKLLLPVREGLAAAQRFQREARAAAMLCDPQVVATYDFGRHNDAFYLVMELVEGRTLSEELKRNGPMEPDRALGIVRQVASGLADAHRHGLIHRDIKPGNLLLTADDQVKIADFGIVRILGDMTTTLTATGQIVGTSHYLAPERARGEPAGAASDVYALGCVLYQLVTGHPPFMADDPASIMYQHVETMPTPPSELRPQLAGEFEALLFWMLAKDPADRPTAAQILAGAVPPAIVPTQPLPVVPIPHNRRSRHRLVAAAAVLAIALITTLGLVLDAKSDKLPATTEFKPPAASIPSTPAPPPSPARKPTTATTSAPAKPTPSRTQSADAGASAKSDEKAKEQKAEDKKKDEEKAKEAEEKEGEGKEGEGKGKQEKSGRKD
ncbi:serine/threonine-protein kinase [Kribbella sp. CA-294648]|uniref:serine/threonine-protein kinase n=1 Tax=Kribbella sp. CA-294648 TaxID=3239948 RepID=UPI003D8CD834